MTVKTRRKTYFSDEEKIAEMDEHAFWGDLPRKYKKKKFNEYGEIVEDEDF